MGVKLSYASRVVLVDSEHIAIEESAILSAPFEISAALDFRVKSTHPETRKSTKKTSEIADVAVFRHPNSGPIESIGPETRNRNFANTTGDELLAPGVLGAIH